MPMRRTDLPSQPPDPTLPATPGGAFKPGMYLHLFHGRDTPDEQMDDWGFEGPLIGPLKFVAGTYGTEIRLEFTEHEDCRRYFPAQNVVSSVHLTGPSAHRGIDGLDTFRALNDPAERQALMDRGVAIGFTFNTQAELPVQEGLVVFDGQFYGDWSVEVVGVVLPTASQMCSEMSAPASAVPPIDPEESIHG